MKIKQTSVMVGDSAASGFSRSPGASHASATARPARAALPG